MRGTLAVRVGWGAIAIGVAAGALAVASPADAATQYRRWSGPKGYTCGPASGGQVAVTLADQNTEVAGSALGMEFTLDYVDNGVTTTDGPFQVEPDGVHAYGSFLETFPTYPFTFDFRITTLLGGEAVFTSTLSVTCAADGSGTVTPVDVETPPADTPYRRWRLPKTYRCETTATGVRVLLSDQQVELHALPPGAEFSIVYIDNGVAVVDGPYPVEASDGLRSYGAFAETFDAYPFTFDFQLTTIVGGNVVYTSTLHLPCTGDTEGSLPVTVTNVGPIAPPTTTTTTTTTSTTIAPSTTAAATSSSTATSAAATTSSVASEPVVVEDPVPSIGPATTASAILPRTGAGGDGAALAIVALAFGSSLLVVARRPARR